MDQKLGILSPPASEKNEKRMVDFFNLITGSESLQTKTRDQVFSTVRAFIDDIINNIPYFLEGEFLKISDSMTSREKALNEKLVEFSDKYGEIGRMGTFILATNACAQDRSFSRLMENKMFEINNLYVPLMDIILDILYDQLPEKLRQIIEESDSYPSDSGPHWLPLYRTLENICYFRGYILHCVDYNARKRNLVK